MDLLKFFSISRKIYVFEKWNVRTIFENRILFWFVIEGSNLIKYIRAIKMPISTNEWDVLKNLQELLRKKYLLIILHFSSFDGWWRNYNFIFSTGCNWSYNCIEFENYWKCSHVRRHSWWVKNYYPYLKPYAFRSEFWRILVPSASPTDILSREILKNHIK